jgi:hypothetical protein
MHRCLRVRRIALFGVWFLYSVAILGMSDHTTTFQYRASSTMGILPPTIQYPLHTLTDPSVRFAWVNGTPHFRETISHEPLHISPPLRPVDIDDYCRAKDVSAISVKEPAYTKLALWGRAVCQQSMSSPLRLSETGASSGATDRLAPDTQHSI